eukprot:UN02152
MPISYGCVCLAYFWTVCEALFLVFFKTFLGHRQMFAFVSLVFRFCFVFSTVGLISFFEHACIEWYLSFFGSLRSLIYLREFCFDFSVLEGSIFRFFASPHDDTIFQI